MLNNYNNPNTNDINTDENLEDKIFDDIGSKGGQSSSDELKKNDTNSNDARGFASMDPQKQKQIASKGGKAAHKKGTAHEWDAEEAREAGKKGGQS